MSTFKKLTLAFFRIFLKILHVCFVQRLRWHSVQPRICTWWLLSLRRNIIATRCPVLGISFRQTGQSLFFTESAERQWTQPFMWQSRPSRSFPPSKTTLCTRSGFTSGVPQIGQQPGFTPSGYCFCAALAAAFLAFCFFFLRLEENEKA